MKTSLPGIVRRSLSWLVVILELVLGFLILVLLGTTQVDSRILLQVTTATVLGFAPILAACIATRNPRRASRVALWLTPAALFLERLPLHFLHLPVSLITAMATTLFPGLFWLVAARRSWPLPLSAELFPRKPLLSFAAVISLVFILVVGSIGLSLVLPWWPPIGDCGGRPLLDENGKPRDIDFTARILYVGPQTFRGYSLFSVARVEDRFSDSIWAVPRVVVLRDFFLATDRGEDFFVEGKRSLGPFTRFLPVVERVECGHSSRMSVAMVSLQTLREGSPRSGVRVIGAVFTSWRKQPKPLPGIEVLVKGPSGTTVAVTDNQGIYDLTGLPFGQYTVELSTKGAHPICALNLEKLTVDGCNLFLDDARSP